MCSKSNLQVASYIRTWPLGSTREDMAKFQYWSAKDVKGEYLTDLIISFANINQDDWTIFLPDVDLPDAHFKNFWDEFEAIRARTPNLKMHLSVGGWGADGYSQMTAVPERRAKFIKSVMEVVKAKDLDGIDIDWEYPIGPDWGSLPIAATPEDGEHYIALLTELRQAFNEYEKETGKYIVLSSAIPANPWYVKKLDAAKVASCVDSLKLMSYDYFGVWTEHTGHHAGLYKNPANPDKDNWSTDEAVKMFLKAGVPAEKIIVGVAFYGRAWKGVPEGGTHGFGQTFKEPAFPDGISWPDIKELLKPGSGYTRYWDDVAKVPYLYNGDIFITYVDQDAVQAVSDYVNDNKLGGAMVWEYGHDTECELFKILKKNFQ